MLMSELPDLFCMQEVDFLKDWFVDDFEQKYNLLFHKKPRSTHGCMTGYRFDRFEFITEKVIQYDDYVPDLAHRLVNSSKFQVGHI